MNTYLVELISDLDEQVSVYVEAKDEVYAKNLLNKMIKRMEELR